MDPRLLLVVGGIAGAATLQGPLGDSNAERRANDFRYTPDPRVMRVVAGAHRSTMADLLWLRALPDMARPFNDRAMKKRWIAGATEVITDLEPSFWTVYAYGADHLSLIDRNPDEAIKLLRKGIERNRDFAGLYVRLAMVYYEYKHDKGKTVELLEEASKLPGIDSMSLAMLAAMKVDDHQDLPALLCWEGSFRHAPNAKVRTISEYEWWRTKKLIAARASREFAKAHKGVAPKSAADVRDPKLIDPAVLDTVTDGLEFDAKGTPTYARLTELERDFRILQAESWAAAFTEGEGRPPTETEFFGKFGELPAPPPGKKWRFAGGKLSLVEE